MGMGYMNNLPKGWTSCKLEEIVAYKKGTKPKILVEEKKKDFVPYIDIRAFEKNEIRQFADIASSKISSKKDVLVVWDGARCGLVGKGKDGAIGSTIMCLTPKCVSSEYIYFFLKTQYDEINSNHKGTGIPHVKPEIFWNIEIPIAPITEQHRIVAKLDKLLSKVETAKSRLDTIPQILKRFRQSVLSAAVSGELTKNWRENNTNVESGKIIVEKIQKELNTESIISESTDEVDLPQNWFCAKLEAITDLIGKGSSPTWQGIKYTYKGVLFITSENVGEGNILLSNKKYLQNEFNQIQKRTILKKGDILTNLVGASIGRTAIYDIDEIANINQAVCLIRLHALIKNEFILHYFNSPKIIHAMEELKVDVARANLSLTDIRNFDIPVPPAEEQQEIVRRVEQLFKFADQIEARYNKAKQYTDKLTQSILAKAFRGELVPQDPNDEPADKLLERIKINTQ